MRQHDVSLEHLPRVRNTSSFPHSFLSPALLKIDEPDVFA